MRRILASFLCLALLAAPAMAQDVNNPPPIVGLWTPTLTGSTSGSWTLSAAVGSYEKTGRQVIARFNIIASASTAVGNVVIGALPFPVSTENGHCVIAGYSVSGLAAASAGLTGVAVAAATSFVVSQGTTTTPAAVTAAQAGSTPFFQGLCIYRAS